MAATTENLKALLHSNLLAIWRRKWIAAAICWVVCALGWTAVMTIPDRYQSSARVYVNVDSLLTPLLRGLAVETNPLQQLDYMERTLLSRPNLEQIAHLANLDLATLNSTQKQELLSALSSGIRIGLQGQHLFDISYENRDPVIARNVVQAVLTVFSESTAGTNRADMDNARKFLNEQIASYEKQLRAAEERRAKFREKYADILPIVLGSSNQLDGASNQIISLRNQLADAIARRDSLKKQLADTPTTVSLDQAAPIVIANGKTISPETIRAQLDQARRQLPLLLAQDTEQNPDVISLRREIAALEKELENDKNGSKKDSGAANQAHSTVSNVVYQQLKLRLADAEGNVASLQRQVADAVANRERLNKLVRQAPEIELQSQNIDRDYGILKKNYEELIARRESTHITEAADTQADKVQFRTVDPPQVPLQPAAPNRPLLFSGVLLAGLGAGVGAAFLLGQLDQSFSSIGSLRRLGLPVIGTVSQVNLSGSRRRTVKHAAALVATALVLLTIYGVLVAAVSGIPGRMI
jgi:polysaccharide chain length determinant protein (PEP-CTERM system associated)